MRTQTNEQAKRERFQRASSNITPLPKGHQSARKRERFSEDARCFHQGEQNEGRKRAIGVGKFEDGFIEQD